MIYSQENNILSFIRFVDDGLGFYAGTVDDFNTWFESMRIKSVDLYGLDFTVAVNNAANFTQFLDIFVLSLLTVF